MKNLLTILSTLLLISCATVVPKNVGIGHVHQKGDTVQVCYEDKTELWVIVKKKRDLYIIESVYDYSVLGNGKLDMSGTKVIYDYHNIEKGRVFVYFEVNNNEKTKP